MPTTKASRRAVKKYEDANTRHYGVRINKKLDPELFEFVDRRSREYKSFNEYFMYLFKLDMRIEKAKQDKANS